LTAARALYSAPRDGRAARKWRINLQAFHQRSNVREIFVARNERPPELTRGVRQQQIVLSRRTGNSALATTLESAACGNAHSMNSFSRSISAGRRSASITTFVSSV
jgi:hypothetical protein